MDPDEVVEQEQGDDAFGTTAEDTQSSETDPDTEGF